MLSQYELLRLLHNLLIWSSSYLLLRCSAGSPAQVGQASLEQDCLEATRVLRDGFEVTTEQPSLVLDGPRSRWKKRSSAISSSSVDPDRYGDMVTGKLLRSNELLSVFLKRSGETSVCHTSHTIVMRWNNS
jgi:hypothetical protein